MSKLALDSIPASRRSEIIIYAKQDRDKNLIHDLNKLGFLAIREVAHAERIYLDHDTHITALHDGEHSCHLLSTHETKILHLGYWNHLAVFESKDILDELSLNPGELSLLIDSGSSRYNQPELYQSSFRNLKAYFKPHFSIPHIPNIYFCHKENQGANSLTLNRLNELRDYFSSQESDRSLLLLPGDQLELNYQSLNQTGKNKSSMNQKISTLDTLTQNRSPYNQVNYRSQEELNRIILSRLDKIRSNSDFITLHSSLKQLSKITFDVRDLGVSVCIDKLKRPHWSRSPKPFQGISLSSDSLAYAFERDHGIRTLLNNKRFEAENRTEICRLMILENLLQSQEQRKSLGHRALELLMKHYKSLISS